MKKNKNIGIILSGGSGSRFKQPTPKQFFKIAGKSILEHTIFTFNKNENISEILIVSKHDYIDKVWEIVNQNNFTKVTAVISGGSERYESTIAAINHLQDYSDNTNLIIHDSVRPFLKDSIINESILKLKKSQAVNVVIPSADTIVEINSCQQIKTIPQRNSLRRGQTPQSFKLGLLKSSYEKAILNNDISLTCDCSVVSKYSPEIPIETVSGCLSNIKITEPSDIHMADKIFQMRGFELKKTHNADYFKNTKDQVIVIFGASYGIGQSLFKLLHENGAKVYALSRSATNTDITNKEQVKEALSEIYRKEGRIDSIVNTAALLLKKPLSFTNYDEVDVVIATNLKGALTVAKESYPYLLKSKGSLINYTSSSYTRGRANYSIYSSTKAAIVNLTQALAEEWLADGIRVNCINPERTDTPMRRKNFGNEPKNTLLEAEDVAKASVQALLTKQSGQILDIKLTNL